MVAASGNCTRFLDSSFFLCFGFNCMQNILLELILVPVWNIFAVLFHVIVCFFFFFFTFSTHSDCWNVVDLVWWAGKLNTCHHSILPHKVCSQIKKKSYGVKLVQLLVFPKMSVWLESHLAFQRMVGFATSLLSLIKSKILVVDVDLKYLGYSVN